jgi:hypothetical protein
VTGTAASSTRHRQPQDVSELVRRPDQPAQQDRDADDFPARRRDQQVQEVLPGRPGRFGDLDAAVTTGPRDSVSTRPRLGRCASRVGASAGRTCRTSTASPERSVTTCGRLAAVISGIFSRLPPARSAAPSPRASVPLTLACAVSPCRNYRIHRSLRRRETHTIRPG